LKARIKAVDISAERRIVKSKLGWTQWSGDKINNATGGNMVESPPQYEMIA
jgi:hypothetical protein